MARQKKFGAFAGVFTPSILTILGVIMYMRMGWVVGNAGLIGTIIIIVIAHIISITTGLSVSSIATDKKVGAGGIYYILSRSMGIPIGGAIGITLYIGTAFSIALYLIGFAESFNGYFGFETSINGLRIVGSIALLVLLAIALISTSVALKTQFFILAAIVISLVSISFGSNEFAPESVVLFSSGESVPLEIVFAIFFPAVTGFTAGVAMSGDLKDPKKSLPIGTIASIAVGFVVYIGLAIFLSYYVSSDILKSDYNILMRIALYAPAVVAGIWGATLSSALGGILGGPRILQAMSIDKVTPRFFGKGKGKNNEPVNALILVFVIAQTGILIGELDVIARVVSMFYLAAYGFINLSFFLESWANPDFQPTFKVNRWFGLLGFLASFGIMFKLDMIAMFGAIIIIVGIYLLLQRKQIQLESGDVWQSVWENVVAKGLKKLDAKETDTSNNWNPNIILFSGESTHRSYILELSNTISGRTGIVTNFKLILDKKDDKPLKKTEQIVKERSFENLGIFARQVKVSNIYKGIENIASTFGFSGVEPNTIMMGWPKELSNSEEYSKMTQSLLRLDYNLLYLDFDRNTKFGKYQSVDLWWRETDNKNAEMMLNIVRFIIQSPEWNKAKIRVLFVNHNNIDSNIIKSKIEKLVEELRVIVEIKIINNGVEQRPFYDIIAYQSAKTDLTIVGIPNIKTEKQADFIVNTNHLFKNIGSTLMVKASNNFNELELDLSQDDRIYKHKQTELKALPTSKTNKINTVVAELDVFLAESVKELSQPALSTIGSFYSQLIDSISNEFDKTSKKLESKQLLTTNIIEVQNFLNTLIILSEKFKESKLHSVVEVFDKGINKLLSNRDEFLKNVPRILNLNISNLKKVKWKNILNYYLLAKTLPNTENIIYDFGVRSFMLINTLTQDISKESQLYIENISVTNKDALTIYRNRISKILNNLKKVSLELENQTSQSLHIFDRDICIELIHGLDNPDFAVRIKKLSTKLDNKDTIIAKNNLTSYASNWYRNQLLAHKQAESNLQLAIAGLTLTTINDRIKTHINDSIIYPQQHKIEILTKAQLDICKGLSKKELEKYTNHEIDEIAETISQINFDRLLESEEENILSISNVAPRIAKLLSPESFNEFLKNQTNFVETITIDLTNIQHYIIENFYLAPLHDTLQNLKISFNENSESIYNSANRIKHLIDEFKKEGSTKGFEDIIEDIKLGIATNITNLNNLTGYFDLNLKSNLHQTTDTLTTRSIIDSADLLSKAAKKPIKQHKFKDWVTKTKIDVHREYKKITNFIIQRKQDIDTLKFDEKHHKFSNLIEETNNFVSSLSIHNDVKKQLPFYYKKLFTGSHVANVDAIRKNELDTAKKVIKRIDQGICGAIMIIGKSQSGKSFFTEAIAKIPENTDKYIINPPSKQTYTPNDLHESFQKTFNKRGSSLAIVKQLKSKSVFIFNDLEKWWYKGEEGNATIDYLSKLIEKYGNKHYFFLNANINSFHIIRKNTNLEKQLLATIIIPPVNKTALKRIIINRHKIGGAEIWNNDELVNDTKTLDKIISKIYDISDGNIGVSLNTWVSNIMINDDNQLEINIAQNLAFPKINNAQWKLLLYYFILHKKLSKNQLKKLFKSEINEIMDTIKEMKKADLIYQSENEIYSIRKNARYFVEKQLKELNILS